MSVWKEIRCDALEDGPQSADCYSRKNSGPMGFESAAELMREAKAEGWKGTMEKVLCPACFTARKDH